MKVIRVALSGASGRMGREIALLAKQKGEFTICAGLDQKISVGEFETYTRLVSLEQRKPDVVIDFSSPAGTMEIVDWCVKKKKAIVIGTTGFKLKNFNLIEKASKKIPIFMSPNMSLGVNAMREAMQAFLKAYGSCEIEIEEIHHKDKKDKPSGTAIFLKDAVEEVKKSNQKVSSPVSLRGGEVYGIHKVYFFGGGEWVSFEHHAQGRALFAEGALAASRWILKQKAGLYSMKDLLKK